MTKPQKTTNPNTKSTRKQARSTRPLYAPNYNEESTLILCVEQVQFDFYSGFDISQKQKSIASFHATAKQEYGLNKILEISTKSEDPLGRALSAMNLKIERGLNSPTYVENAFQSAKVFEKGGPYKDLLNVPPQEAKKDPRLKQSGVLIGFESAGIEWDNEPKTAFYNWVYINALYQQQDCHQALLEYEAFTDIEFNPKKSYNCQAMAVALFCALYKRGWLEHVLKSKEAFLGLHEDYQIQNTEDMHNKPKDTKEQQMSLL